MKDPAAKNTSHTHDRTDLDVMNAWQPVHHEDHVCSAEERNCNLVGGCCLVSCVVLHQLLLMSAMMSCIMINKCVTFTCLLFPVVSTGNHTVQGVTGQWLMGNSNWVKKPLLPLLERDPVVNKMTH